MPKFLNNLDLNQNQMLNALLHLLATDPASPTAGQVWYRTDTGDLRVRSTGATRRLAEVLGSGAVSVTYNGDGTVTLGVSKAAIDALNVDADTLDGLDSTAFAAAAHDHVLDTDLTDVAVTSVASGEILQRSGALWINRTLAEANIAPLVHTHPTTDITDLAAYTGLDGRYYTESEIDAALLLKLSTSLKGAANGLAELDGSGKVPVAQLPDSVFGGLDYQGTWNASTNTPTLTATPLAAGAFYKVSVAGTTSLGGVDDWGVGDWIISDGTTWQKVDNSELVTSVAGRTGDVVLEIADIGSVETLQVALDRRATDFFTNMAVAETSGAGYQVGNHYDSPPIAVAFDFATYERVEVDWEYVPGTGGNVGQWRVLAHWIGSQRLSFTLLGVNES